GEAKNGRRVREPAPARARIIRAIPFASPSSSAPRAASAIITGKDRMSYRAPKPAAFLVNIEAL
ncbi:MAG TPA: hypothetical protein DEA40_05660, partial [Parvularcula sp.]|nr:hypothetical protein [Parvularcula sp.]